MTRTVLVADETATQLGAEQLTRLQGPEWAQRMQRWDCHGWIEPDTAAAVLLPRAPELEHQDTGAGPSLVVHTHPTCQPSQVMTLSLAEVEARRAAHTTKWGSRGRAGVKRAMRAGQLTGGVVPVELVGSGNADVPGSVYR